MVKHLLLATSYGVLGVIITLLVGYIMYLQNRPELKPWHVVDLTEEFTINRSGKIQTFEAYLKLEDRLFSQLRRTVYQHVDNGNTNPLNRYYEGSLADPANDSQDWNRSFELTIENPRGGVLLVHGLSDSPYSMRGLAKTFHEQGFYVVGLRLPGHGTAPAGLTTATWQDFAAATRLVAKYVRQKIGKNKPFYMGGFYTGMEYSMQQYYSF